MKRKVTAADVARAAGVSPATVDRVLNGRGGVVPAKERRVLECAQRLGLDRNLRLRPTRVLRVAAVTGYPTNPFYDSLRKAYARANGLFAPLNIQVSVTFVDAARPEEAARSLRNVAGRCDAMVSTTTAHPAIVAALCEIASRMPLVTMVSDVPEVPRLAYVGLDNTASGRVAGDLAARFAGRAGGDLLVVTDHRDMFALREREEGFARVVAERHPGFRVTIVDTRGRAEAAAAAVVERLDRHRLAGIYVTSTGNRAIAAVLAQRAATDTVMITHELTEDRRGLLKAGIVDAIIDQNPEHEAFTAIEALAHHFGRLDTGPTLLVTPFTLYFRENC